MLTNDLLAWANTTDAVTLPAIQQDVAQLENMQASTSALLSNKVQEFGDKLDAHTVSLAVNFSASEVANTRSYSALSQLYDINQRVTNEIIALRNQLRAELQTNLNARDVSFGVAVKNNIMGEVNASVGSALALVNIEVSNIQNVSDQVTLVRTEILSAVDGVMDITLPMLNSMQGVVLDRVNAADNLIAYHLAGFDKPTLIEGIDQIITDTGATVSGLRAEYESSLAGVQEQVSAANSFVANHLAGFDKPTLLAGIDQVMTDTGAMVSGLRVEYEASLAGLNSLLAQDYYTIVAADQAVSVATQALKASMEGVGGSVYDTMAYAQATEANLTTNYLTSTQVEQAVASFNMNLNASFSTTAESLAATEANLATNYLTGTQIDQAISAFDMSLNAYTSNTMALVEDTNANLATNYLTGTQINSAIASVETALNASIGDLNSVLVQGYYTTVDADQATSMATQALKSSLEGVNGSIYATMAYAQSTQASLTTNYLTSTEIDQVISSFDLNLNASFSGFSALVDQNYYTTVAADQATSVATQALKSSLEGVNGSIYEAMAYAQSTQASLTTNYLTSTQIDQAISSFDMNLNASFSATKESLATTNANLTTNYLTSTQVESAITAIDTSLNASIDNLNSFLIQNYYTTVDADQATSVATQALKSSLEETGGSIYEAMAYAQATQSNLTTNYLTGTQVGQTIASFDMNLNASFSTTKENLATTNANLTTNYLTSTQVESAITAIDTSLNASIANMNSFLIQNYYTTVDADQAISLATQSLQSSLEGVGGSIHANMVYAQATQSNLTTNYLTSTQVDQAISSFDLGLNASFSGLNAFLDQNYYTVAEADQAMSLATQALKSSLEGTGGSIYETLVFAQATQADLTTNYLTNAQVGQAIASFDMSLNASIGSVSADVEVNSAALVSLNGKAASTYAVQAVAGGGVGSFEIVAWDDIGGSGSAVKINADNILLEGTVSANKLVIGDFTNHVNDPNGKFLGNWSFDTPVVSQSLWVSSNAADPVSSGLSLSTVTGVAQEFMNTSKGFAVPSTADSIDVLPGETYLVKAWVYKAPGSSPVDAYLGFRVTNYASNASEYAQFGATWLADESGWREIKETITIPDAVNGLPASMALVSGGVSSRSTLDGIQVIFGGMSIRKATDAVMIADGVITADKMNVEWLNAGRISAEYLDVNALLTIQEAAGLRYQKSSVNEDNQDGLYFGVDGGEFGFAASRTSGAGRNQRLKLSSQDGLRLLNANHYVSGASMPTAVGVASNLGRTALPAGTKTVSVDMIGGGGGGAGWNSAPGNNVGSAGVGGSGGTTQVRLYNNNVLVTTYNAGGGGGGGGSLAPNNQPSYATAFGNYGRAGAGKTRTYSRYIGSDGGNEYFYNEYTYAGGNGGYVSTVAIDVSSWTNPSIEVTIGGGGAGGGSQIVGNPGNAGYARYFWSVAQDLKADVVPLAPTSVGTFVASYAEQPFPNLGGGLWTLTRTSGTGLTAVYGQGHQVWLNGASSASFVSGVTPKLAYSGAYGETIYYAHHSMGNWG
jgi:hypothetical protein